MHPADVPDKGAIVVLRAGRQEAGGGGLRGRQRRRQRRRSVAASRDLQPPGRIRSVSPRLGEPLMGEGVAEPMRVQVGQAGLAAAAPARVEGVNWRTPTR
jgi:hypothetical protein